MVVDYPAEKRQAVPPMAMVAAPKPASIIATAPKPAPIVAMEAAPTPVFSKTADLGVIAAGIEASKRLRIDLQERLDEIAKREAEVSAREEAINIAATSRQIIPEPEMMARSALAKVSAELLGANKEILRMSEVVRNAGQRLGAARSALRSTRNMPHLAQRLERMIALILSSGTMVEPVGDGVAADIGGMTFCELAFSKLAQPTSGIAFLLRSLCVLCV